MFVFLIPIFLFVLQKGTSWVINLRVENSMLPDNTVTQEIIALVSDWWRVNNEDKTLPVIEKNRDSFQFGIVNDNDKLIYMKDIWVIEKCYEQIKEKWDTGFSGIVEPIYLVPNCSWKEGC